ncbi:MAG: fibronectin type III domain-containing protein [Deltaproteobacteria bacterium]|nr:fibronectin type III domain-containing protein [Deltaproteobacteria bacterium]
MKDSLVENIIYNFSRLEEKMKNNRKSNSPKRIKLFNKKFYGLTPFLFFLCLILMLPVIAQAASITMTWNRNQEPDIAGYKIFYGTQSGYYTDSITVNDTVNQPQQRSYTIAGLSEGTTYYFVLKAFDRIGQESEYSNEILLITTSSDEAGGAGSDGGVGGSDSGGETGGAGGSSSDEAGGTGSGEIGSIDPTSTQNAAPSYSLSPYPLSEIITPADTLITINPALTSITPQISVNDCSDVLQPIMYIWVPQYEIGIDVSLLVFSSCESGVLTLDLSTVDFTDWTDFVFDVYYGYVDQTGNIYYNAYEVKVSAVPQCGGLDDQTCSQTQGCMWQEFPTPAQCVVNCAQYSNFTDCESAFGGDVCEWQQIIFGDICAPR